MNMIRAKVHALSAVMCLLFAFFSVNAGAQTTPWVGDTLDGRVCALIATGVAEGYGPFDYRFHKNRLPLVEGAHFTPDVENLVRGKTAEHPMPDINYTLNRFPNHHRALYAAIRYALGESSYPRREGFYAECYLQRAINFSPTDPTPYMLFGLYLHRMKKLDRALEMYERAEDLAPNDGNLLYNMGLLHFDLGNYDQSRHYADEAYRRGIDLPGLRRKLQEASHRQ
ncbi:MAG: hypothetical protein R3F41_15455 [Gammaproteobacteria bacterium]|nr:hypothetical protein [Pseudomonadales bacterium]